jgi:hypothetical protein
MYARKNDFAFVVDSNDYTLLAKEIHYILKHKEICAQKIRKAQEVGLTYHSAEKSAEIYCKTLSGN